MEDLNKKYEKLKDDFFVIILALIGDDFSKENKDEFYNEQDHKRNKDKQFLLSIRMMQVICEFSEKGDNTHNEEIDNYFSVFSRYIKERLWEKNGENSEYLLECLFLLEIFLGKNIYLVLKNISNFYIEDKAYDIDREFIRVISIVNTRRLREEEGIRYAESIIENFLSLTLRKYFNQKKEKIINILHIINYYYLYFGDFDKALALFLENEVEIEKIKDKETINICFQLSAYLEKIDSSKAVSVIDKCIEILKEQKNIVKDWFLWMIEYQYNVFHYLYLKEVERIYELEKLYYKYFQLSNNKPDDCEICLMKNCYFILNHIIDENKLEIAETYFNLTCKWDEQFKDSPIANKKIALHFLGSVYYSRGQIQVAKGYFERAEKFIGKYPNKDVDIYILSNLILIDNVARNLKQGKERARILYRSIINGDYPDISQNMVQRIVSYYSNFYDIEGNSQYSLKILKEALDRGVLYDNKEEKLILEIYRAIILKTLKIKDNNISDEESKKFMSYLNNIESSNYFSKLDKIEKLLYDMTKILYFYSIKDTSYLYNFYKENTIDLDEIKEWQATSYAEVFIRLATMFFEIGDIDKSKIYSDKLVSLWKKYLYRAVEYSDKESMSKYLDRIQEGFLIDYSICDDYISDEELYEKVLNYKNLFSFMMGYRNRFLKKYPESKSFSDKINKKKNKLAEIETRKAFLNLNTDSSQIKKEIKELEYKFAKTFEKNNISIEEFKVKDLIDAMEDNSIVVEYFISIQNFNSYVLHKGYLNDLTGKQYLTTFCLIKKEGKNILNKYKTIITEELLEGIDIFMNQSRKLKRTIKPQALLNIKNMLYEAFIKSWEKELFDNINKIYIATDSFLCDIPFELLLEKEITYLESGRDLIIRANEACGNGAIIIGNPEYDYKNIIDYGDNRSFINEEIKSLPFSEIETKLIAKKLNVEPYIGKKALKSVIIQAKNVRFIHIATHGIQSNEYSNDAWYSLGLLLAGAENWKESKRMDKLYGNGIITADEISRLDFSSVEVVVLSCCNSGIGQITNYNQMAGIRQAFKAAGVKYIISSLWSVDDFAGALLMNKFYEFLRKYNVKEALKKSKEYLKNATAKDVKIFLNEYVSSFGYDENGLIERKLNELNKESMNKVLSFKKSDEKIYENPYYWAGFICQQNRN